MNDAIRRVVDELDQWDVINLLRLRICCHSKSNNTTLGLGLLVVVSKTLVDLIIGPIGCERGRRSTSTLINAWILPSPPVTTVAARI